MKECMNGYAFVEEVIEFSRENAVDILMSKAIDECDWLELKASFYVSEADKDFLNEELLSKKPNGFSDRQWLDALNKGRIVKDIVALYNSRGGVIFIGIAPDGEHKLVPLCQNDPDGILKSRGFNDYRSKLDGLLSKGGYRFGTEQPAQHCLSIPVTNLYESKILPYKDGCVIALIVKSGGYRDSCVITCGDKRSTRNGKSYLVFRTEAGDNCEEIVTGITETKKDELDRRRYALLRKSDLEQLFKEITGGEPPSQRTEPITWREVWHNLWTFSLRGKATRAELWMAYGYYSVFVMGAICLSMIFGSSRILSIVQSLGFVLLAPPFVRRLHDWGLSGWCLLVLIGFGMFEVLFPALTTAKRVVNGFFYLGLLSFGSFPGRRVYGRYKGAAVSICYFALLLLGGFMNRSVESEVDDEIITDPRPSDFEDESDPTGNDAVVYGIDAVGNEYEETFDKVVIPALKERKNKWVPVFGTSIERMASDMHRVGFLAERLSGASEGELGGLDKEFCGMVKNLIVAFDDLAKVSMRENVSIVEIRKSFAQVETETDLLFRKADVLCKDRWKGPFQGLIHRISDALRVY